MGRSWKVKLLDWIIYSLFKHEEGIILPWYLRWLWIVMMPIEYIRYMPIYGYKYSGTLFRTFAFGGIGESFKIIERRDRLIVIEKVSNYV